MVHSLRNDCLINLHIFTLFVNMNAFKIFSPCLAHSYVPSLTYPVYTPVTTHDQPVFYISNITKKYPTLYIPPGLSRDQLIEAIQEILTWRTMHHVSIDEHGDFVHPSGYTRLLIDVCKAMM